MDAELKPRPATPSTGTSASPTAVAPTLEDCEMFPANAIFNTRIDDTSKFPAHANSWNWINTVGAATPFLANWGVTDNPADVGYYGIPVNVVDGTPATTDWPLLSYNFAASGVNTLLGYPEKSDCAVPDGTGFRVQNNCSGTQPGQVHFPFPKANVLSEHGTCNDANSCGDRHVLVVEKGACRLWESYYAYNIWGNWYAMSTAAWDLKSNALRPNGWGSADAAGLPITPLLAKASEAQSGEIRHALRVTFRDAAIALNWNWPARFSAGGDTPGGIPMGALLRLKADFVIPDSWSPQAKAVATAAKRYGLYVADNGMDFYVQGAPSSGWGDQTYGQLRSISLSNMEFVDLKAITGDARFNVNSMQASW
ncbi:MAG TPA: hypothetical protein VK996_05915 [Ramlibacter sp.]|nr:hypothetical protein [Ramlibacter sp.]